MTILKGNYIFARPGEPAFLAASNFVNYLSLGDKAKGTFYLEARIENGEHKLSGRLWTKEGKFLCELRDNAIVSGECKVVPIKQGGYEVRAKGNQLQFSVRLQDGKTCLIQGKFYDESGHLVAEGNRDDFRIFKGPAILGKSGASAGIVIGS